MNEQEINLSDSIEDIKKKASLAKSLKEYYLEIEKDAAIISLGLYLENLVKKYPDYSFNLNIEPSGNDLFYNINIDESNMNDIEKDLLENIIIEEINKICDDQFILKEMQNTTGSNGDIHLNKSETEVIKKVAQIFHGENNELWYQEKKSKQLSDTLNDLIPLKNDRSKVKL